MTIWRLFVWKSILYTKHVFHINFCKLRHWVRRNLNLLYNPLEYGRRLLRAGAQNMNSMPSTLGLNIQCIYPSTRKLSDLRKLPVPTKSIILRFDSLLATGWSILFRRYKYKALPAKNITATAPKSVPIMMPALAMFDLPFGFGPIYVCKHVSTRAVRHTINLLTDTHHEVFPCYWAGLSEHILLKN